MKIHAKDLYAAKCQFVSSKRESTSLKHFNDSKAFIGYSNDIYEIHKNIEEYKQNKKIKILIVFDDMITNMLNNRKRNPIVTELFLEGKKLNISLVFITQSYFAYFTVQKNINSTHYFIMKISNKRQLQQLAFDLSSDT